MHAFSTVRLSEFILDWCLLKEYIRENSRYKSCALVYWKPKILAKVLREKKR